MEKFNQLMKEYSEQINSKMNLSGSYSETAGVYPETGDSGGIYFDKNGYSEVFRPDDE